MAIFYQTCPSRPAPPKLYVSHTAKGKRVAIAKFRKILYNSAFTHFCFSFFLMLQLIILAALLYSSYKSIYTAASIAILFFSLSSYILISFYQKNKKLDYLTKICDEFIRNCSIQLSKNITDNEELHLAITECAQDLSDSIEHEELFYLNIYPFKFSKNHIFLYFLYFHYNDFITLKQTILKLSLENLGKIIEESACSLQFHHSLSKTYSSLASCYRKPYGRHLEKAYRCIIFFKKIYFEEQLNKYYNRAEDEMFILCDLSNNESWTHIELANLYSEFGDTEKEMKQYENILEKISDDKEIIYKLGILFFKT